jgi:hypothetical protein
MPSPEFQAIVAQAPRKKMKILSSTRSVSLAASGVENVDFYSPMGTISRVVALYIWVQAPTGATAGTNSVELLNGTSAGHFMKGSSLYPDQVFFDYSMWMTATAVKNPTTEDAIQQVVTSMYFDSVTPLRVSYTNVTNAANTNNRTIILTVEETQLG